MTGAASAMSRKRPSLSRRASSDSLPSPAALTFDSARGTTWVFMIRSPELTSTSVFTATAVAAAALRNERAHRPGESLVGRKAGTVPSRSVRHRDYYPLPNTNSKLQLYEIPHPPPPSGQSAAD